MSRRIGKRGSYLVEAALTIPIFILAVVMLLSAIPVLSSVENTVFSITDEMRLEMLKSSFRQNQYVLPVKLNGRIAQESEHQRFRVTSCRYLYSNENIDDLITIGYRQSHDGYDLMSMFSSFSMNGRITARAYTGKLHQRAPSSSTTEGQIVYIFPEWGMRYHNQSCTYIQRNCQMTYLSERIQSDYRPCSLCNATLAQIGSPVFCFVQYGETYHLETCRQVSRYYVEVEEHKAREQGYAPCSKCGG